MKTVLITGGSRGLGLELTKQYAMRGDRVFATCRDPESATMLQSLASQHRSIVIEKLDVMDQCSIRSCANSVNAKTNHIDILVNNAGVAGLHDSGLESVNALDLQNVFITNTFAPVLVTQAFRELLQASHAGLVYNLISGFGVLPKDLPPSGSSYAYGSSKAALHWMIPNMAADLKAQGTIVIGMGPGFVLTDLTKSSPQQPPLMPEESAAGMIHTADKLTLEDTGNFYRYDGHRYRWVPENG